MTCESSQTGARTAFATPRAPAAPFLPCPPPHHMLQPRSLRGRSKRRVESDDDADTDYASKRMLSEHMADVIRRLHISAYSSDSSRLPSSVHPAPVDVPMSTNRMPDTPCPSEEDSDLEDETDTADRRFLRSALRAQVRMPTACTALVPYVEPAELVLKALQRRTEPEDDAM